MKSTLESGRFFLWILVVAVLLMPLDLNGKNPAKGHGCQDITDASTLINWLLYTVRWNPSITRYSMFELATNLYKTCLELSIGTPGRCVSQAKCTGDILAALIFLLYTSYSSMIRWVSFLVATVLTHAGLVVEYCFRDHLTDEQARMYFITLYERELKMPLESSLTASWVMQMCYIPEGWLCKVWSPCVLGKYPLKESDTLKPWLDCYLLELFTSKFCCTLKLMVSFYFIFVFLLWMKTSQ